MVTQTQVTFVTERVTVTQTLNHVSQYHPSERIIFCDGNTRELEHNKIKWAYSYSAYILEKSTACKMWIGICEKQVEVLFWDLKTSCSHKIGVTLKRITGGNSLLLSDSLLNWFIV